MRVREKQLELDRQIRVSRAVVLVDDYHQAHIGLGLIDTECMIVADTQEALEALRSRKPQNFAMIDSRPEAFGSAIEWLAQCIVSGDCKTTLIMPTSEFFGVHEALSANTSNDRFAITGLSFADNVAAISLAASSEGDNQSSLFVSGIRLGIESSGKAAWQDPCPSSQARDLEGKLLSVLEAQELVFEEPGTDGFEAESAKTTIDTHDESDRIKELEDQLTTVTSKLDALQRKYNSLAGSRLGKATLKYWSWSRRSGR